MTITQLNNKAIAVTGLPEGAYDFEIKQMSEFFDNHYILTYKTPFGWETFRKRYYDWNTRSEKPLTILGFSQDLKEEDWKRVVEKMPWGEDNYKNYGLDPWAVQYVGKTATESSHTLLISKDIDPLLNHLILIQ